MKRRIHCAIGLLLTAVAVHAADPLEKPILAPEQSAAPPPKRLQVLLAKDEHHEATTKFTSDLPKVRAVWKGSNLDAGDRVGIIWLAEDVGVDAPHNSKISEGVVTAYKPDDTGVFALVQPKGGWPLGKYRCEFYLNGRLTDSVEFTIEKGATVQLQ